MNRDDAPSGFEREYDSGSSAKDMRLGVDAPEDVALRLRVMTPRASGMLSIECAGLGADAMGVTGVEGVDRTLRADCRGGEGGRVEVVCLAFVKSRETEAVAFEVPKIGGLLGGLSSLCGGRGEGRGRGALDVSGEEADEVIRCLSRIWRSECTVCST